MKFLSKLATFVAAESNSLLDKAIDMNSIPMLKQYTRELETAMDSLNHQDAQQAASVTIISREVGDLTHNIEADKAKVTQFLSQNPPAETAAKVVATRIQQETKALSEKQTLLAEAKEQAGKMDAALEAIKTKHATIVSRVRTLETQDRHARDLTAATSAIKKASDLTNSDNLNSSIDNVEAGIRQRSETANVEFDRAISSTTASSPQSAEDAADLDNLLNSLRPTSSAKA
jgi:phage shock protein A